MSDTTMATLRPAISPAPASFSTSERAALAAAIAKFEQLAAHLADTRQRARDGTDAMLSAAYNDRAAAETALKDAEAAASSRALERAIGREAGPTVRQARADLDAARDRFDAVWADRELVQAEIDRLARAVDNAREARDEALAAVLSAAPGFAALVAELPAARQAVQRLENLYAELGKLPGVRLPGSWDTPLLRSRPADWEPPGEVLEMWRDAIAKLTIDAIAPLPGEADGR
jgi:DNA repair exonuclease SbcCD ATPase subunit